MRYNLIRSSLLSGILILVSSITYSQHNKVPPFQIIQSDSKIFMAGNLPMGKPIIIIYFSPECEDCQQLTKELLNRIKEFNNASIAMITNLSLDKVKQFVTEYHLDKYPNIFPGTEGNSFFVGKYYGIGKLPFMALYNKNGDLIKIYDKDISIEDLLIHLRDL
jgi:thiol-disulfide isomerase/thioredoxin